MQDLTPMTPDEVKAFRATMGWSQARLAKETGTTNQTIEAWEKKGAKGYWRLAFAALRAAIEPYGTPKTPSDIRLYDGCWVKTAAEQVLGPLEISPNELSSNIIDGVAQLHLLGDDRAWWPDGLIAHQPQSEYNTIEAVYTSLAAASIANPDL